MSGWRVRDVAPHKREYQFLETLGTVFARNTIRIRINQEQMKEHKTTHSHYLMIASAHANAHGSVEKELVTLLSRKIYGNKMCGFPHSHPSVRKSWVASVSNQLTNSHKRLIPTAIDRELHFYHFCLRLSSSHPTKAEPLSEECSAVLFTFSYHFSTPEVFFSDGALHRSRARS